jgi:hypothetical protein
MAIVVGTKANYIAQMALLLSTQMALVFGLKTAKPIETTALLLSGQVAVLLGI